eukprot:EG_transcript_16865
MERGFALWSDTWDLKDGHYTLNGIQQLITCNDPEALARIIHGLDLSVIPNGASLHVFREGVEPLYDHPANTPGGHFKMQATSVKAAGDVWALLAEHLLAGQLPCSGSVNGVTYMRTLNTRGIKLWMCDAMDKEAVREMRLFLQGLQNNQIDFVNLKFCPHKYILKTLHSQQKAPTASPRPGDQFPPALPTVDRTPDSAAPALPPPAWPGSLGPPRHVYPGVAAAADGAASHYALTSAVAGSYSPAVATSSGLLGTSALLALPPPDPPTPLWLVYPPPAYQPQLKLDAGSADFRQSPSHLNQFLLWAPTRLPYLPHGQ